MNINRKKPEIDHAAIQQKQANGLLESFDRSPDKKTFLFENGDTKENQHLFADLALLESHANPELSFLFENGMSVPSIGAKTTAAHTINGIFESTDNEEEFVMLVESRIAQKFLEFDLTETDKSNLSGLFRKNKQIV